MNSDRLRPGAVFPDNNASYMSPRGSETVGQIVQAYAILSHRYVKPAYCDIMPTGRNVHDAESADMMDLMFAKRAIPRNRVTRLGSHFCANRQYAIQGI